MISIDYTLSVRGFRTKQIGRLAMVRSQRCKLRFDMTNDKKAPLRRLAVRPVLESYVGRERPLLFQWGEPRSIEVIRSEGLESIEVEVIPAFPGLVSVALYVTDATGKTVMVKRESDSDYAPSPVRWWFHVADDVSVKTLRALETLVARTEKTKE